LCSTSTFYFDGAPDKTLAVALHLGHHHAS
jgi:hypothetical protein